MTEDYPSSISSLGGPILTPSPTSTSRSNPSISSAGSILTPSITPSSNPSILTTGSILTPSTTFAYNTNPPSFSSPLRQAHPVLSSAASPAPDGTFVFPRAYHFPPFFTRQPVLQSHHAQLQKWSSLILGYCRHHKIWKLSLVDALDTDLFKNEKLGKRLSRENAKEAIEFMRKEERAEWIGRGETEVWIWWRNVEEWAGLLYEWIDETAQKNTVLTLYELTESEATMSQEFHGMDGELLQKALTVLVKRGKAQVFGQEDQQGVKFF